MRPLIRNKTSNYNDKKKGNNVNDNVIIPLQKI